MRVGLAAIGVMLLGSIGTSAAKPLDSPGTIYIDGVPCNKACQSYMAWSRQVLRSTQRFAAEGSPKASSHRQRSASKSKPATRERSTKQIVAPAVKPAAEVAHLEPSASAPAPAAHPEAAHIPPTTADAPRKRTVQEQVAAALSVAQAMAAASSPEPESTGTSGEARASAADDNKPASEPPKDIDLLVALLICRPEIKSVPALNDANIAVDDSQSASASNIRVALVAAGVSNAQLSFGETNAIDRLIAGDVPAALVSLVSQDAAEAFPDVSGFKVLRVPLSPRAMKAGLEKR
jgi:hypothetical protein